MTSLNHAASSLTNGGAASIVKTFGPNATLVHKLFEGVLTSETRCLTCESVCVANDVCTQTLIYILPSRFHPGMKLSWICQLTLRKIQVFRLVSGNSVQARCFARKTNSSVILVAIYRKQRRGQ